MQIVLKMNKLKLYFVIFLTCFTWQAGATISLSFVDGKLDKAFNNQFIPIEKIKVNDRAWTYDTQSKEKSLQTVTKTFVREVDTLVYVWINKELIQTTAEHPFFTPGLWKPALSLKEGDEVLNYHGNWTKIDSIAVKDTTCTVYNFEVEGNHNYYVGTIAILVHNTCSQTDYFKQLGFEGESLENVQKLFNKSEFRTIYNPLSPELKEQFLKAFNEAPKALEKFGEQPGLIKSWSVLQLKPKSFIKTDMSHLEVFHKLSSDNQKLISQFTDVDANSTLAKFLDDCDDEFVSFLNMTENEDFVKSFLSHKNGVDVTAERAEFITDEIDDISGTIGDIARKWSDRSTKISTNNSKFAKARSFEDANSIKIMSDSDPPCNAWGGNLGKEHLPQLHVKANGSSYRVVLDDAIIAPQIITDHLTGAKYRKAIYHDSKLTRNAPWSTNQTSDIIKRFKDDPNLPYIEFEVRSGSKYFEKYPNSSIKEGDKVRIYREDVYKSIGPDDGNGLSIVETIRMNDNGFN